MRTNPKRFRDENLQAGGAYSKDPALELEQLFQFALELIQEGDLTYALVCFQTYLKQGGRQQDEADTCVRRIAKAAFEAGVYYKKRCQFRYAAANFRLAIDANKDLRESAIREMRKLPTIAPKLDQFKAPTSNVGGAAARALWRRPHMVLATDAAILPGASFAVRVHADQSDSQPGEETELITVGLENGKAVYSLQVRLLASAHFNVEGPSIQPFQIDGRRPVVEAVEFNVKVLSKEQLTGVSEQHPALCAVFTYNGRPVGKVSRTVEILGFESSTEPEDPKYLPKPRAKIAFEAAAKQPDLVITIASQTDNDNRHFWCTVETPLLPEYENGVTKEWNLPDSTSSIVASYMQAFTAPGQTKIERLSSLRGAGKQLFRASPDIFQTAFWKLIDCGADLNAIAIISSEPYIAWELMIPHRDGAPGLPPQVRPPLGVEFCIGRMTRRSLVAGAQRIPLKDSYVIAPIFEGSRKLPHAQEEAEYVIQLFPGERIHPADVGSIDAKLGHCPSLVHFACHGEVQADGRQVLYLDDEKEFTALQLIGLSGPESGISVSQPLIFLNACQVGQPVPGLIGAGGFAAAFAELGARAIVAPLWSVKDTLAHELAMDFYTQTTVKPAVPFAEILRKSRSKAYDPAIAEDTYAAYCFYGDPLAIPV